ncbi:MAG: hypothetical protein N3B13_12835, partial [Deltaproteobacteria bacterium]|nr:hypothetical protein [Deltaproteobacteria bacterium]
DIDKRLRTLIIKATNKDPLARHNDVNEFNTELFEILSVYNELPQNIKDEYHQSISAVETKFTHIKKKISETKSEESGRQPEKPFRKKAFLVVLFLLLAATVAAGLFIYDRFSRETEAIMADIKPEDVAATDFVQKDGPDVYYEDRGSYEGEADIYPQDVSGEVKEKITGKIKEKAEKEKTAGALTSEKQKTEEKKKEEKAEEKTREEKEQVADEKSKIAQGCPKDMIYIKAGSFKMGSVPGDEG